MCFDFWTISLYHRRAVFLCPFGNKNQIQKIFSQKFSHFRSRKKPSNPDSIEVFSHLPKRRCESFCQFIKTRYTLSYLRAHRIGPDRLYDPGRFFPRSGRFTPIAPPEIFHPKPEVHLWFFSWGFLSAGTLYFRVPAGDPGSPIRPAPSVRMGAARRPGPSGPQPPRRPLPPAPTQNKVLYTLLRKLQRGYALQNLLFCASAGSPHRQGGPLAFAPGGKSGGIPPRTTPPDLSRGAPSASLSVGARLRPFSALPRPPRSAASPLRARGGSALPLAPPQRRPLSGAALAPLKPAGCQSVRHGIDSRDSWVAV